MSDVIDRLRKWANVVPVPPAAEAMHDAADEITRLRGALMELGDCVRTSESLDEAIDLMDEAADEIERLRLRWIPYAERYPEDGQKILAVFQVGDGEPWVEAVEFKDYKVRDGGLWRSCKVICWMPLPEPPEVTK